MNNDDTLLLAKELHEDARIIKGVIGDNTPKRTFVIIDENVIFNPLADSTCVALQTKFQLHTAPYYSDRGYSVFWMPIQVTDIKKPVHAIANTINEAVADCVLQLIKERERE